jgi:predicted aldo/keto reductase-like oxidoreductase
VSKGAELIREAVDLGVNLFDTAELYDTYPQLRAGLRGMWGQVHVVSKAYAVDAATMERSLHKALRELDTDCVSVFMLHEVETAASLRGHAEALDYLVRAREKGDIRAVGISTHHVEGVRAAALSSEIDVIQPLINYRGIGIKGGGLPEMLEAIELAHELAKGVYAMKPLGGGHLGQNPREAFDFLLSRPEIASIAVGMRSSAEIRLNSLLFDATRRDDPEVSSLSGEVAATPRFPHVHDWCIGCGACADACPAGAVSVKEGQAEVNREKCLLCGYCGAACPEMAIKII